MGRLAGVLAGSPDPRSVARDSLDPQSVDPQTKDLQESPHIDVCISTYMDVEGLITMHM